MKLFSSGCVTHLHNQLHDCCEEEERRDKEEGEFSQARFHETPDGLTTLDLLDAIFS
jgi:hypothetical protein